MKYRVFGLIVVALLLLGAAGIASTAMGQDAPSAGSALFLPMIDSGPETVPMVEVGGVAAAAASDFVMDAGTMTVNCPGGRLTSSRPTVNGVRDMTRLILTCQISATATPTSVSPTATATAIPATATAIPATATATPTSMPGMDMAMMSWHPTGSHSGLPAHNHGVEPPQWVKDSQWPPMFSHPGNTPNENMLKHTSFKGLSFSDDGVDVYIIQHLDSNPNGHASRFHSSQVWARDRSGAVSYWNLWTDFGANNSATGPNIQPVDSCGKVTTVRPIMQVNYPECPLNFENWYARAAGPNGQAPWAWDLGYNIKPNYYHGPAQGQASNPDLAAWGTWLPTGIMNDVIRVEGAWYADRSSRRGLFWSTQFGQIVSGPNDPLCGTMQTLGGKSYETLCLQQYIAPTMTTVSFPGNALQHEFPSAGIELPN